MLGVCAVNERFSMEAVFPVYAAAAKKPEKRKPLNKKTGADDDSGSSSDEDDYPDGYTPHLVLISAGADVDKEYVQKLLNYDSDDERKSRVPLAINTAKRALLYLVWCIGTADLRGAVRPLCSSPE